jgi:hypothetical protein
MAIDRKSVIVTGIGDIDRRLKTLEPRVQKKVIRQAMRAGLKILQAATEAEAPVLTGATKEAVVVRAVKGRRRGSIELEVRIAADDELKKTSANGKTYFYPAIVQYMYDPFITRAFDSTGEAARQVTIARIREGIEREASRS